MADALTKPEDFDGLMVEPHEHIWCARHGEPFRANYPSGFIVATLSLFQEVYKREDFWEAVKAAVGPRDPDPADALPLLKERRACCRVGKDVLLRLYEESEIGKVDRCKNCRRDRLGTPYQIFDVRKRKVRPLRHVCFDCVLNWMATGEPGSRQEAGT